MHFIQAPDELDSENKDAKYDHLADANAPEELLADSPDDRKSFGPWFMYGLDVNFRVFRWNEKLDNAIVAPTTKHHE